MGKPQGKTPRRRRSRRRKVGLKSRTTVDFQHYLFLDVNAKSYTILHRAYGDRTHGLQSLIYLAEYICACVATFGKPTPVFFNRCSYISVTETVN